jgi:hypothetical protein
MQTLVITTPVTDSMSSRPLITEAHVKKTSHSLDPIGGLAKTPLVYFKSLSMKRLAHGAQLASLLRALMTALALTLYHHSLMEL